MLGKWVPGKWPRQLHLRRQLPVHSPLRLESIASGIGSAFSGEQAVHDVSRRLDERYGPHDLTLTDSGTSALALAMAAVGGPVALPAFCCFDIATASDGAGVQPILYDVDPRTLAPDAGSLARAGRGSAVGRRRASLRRAGVDPARAGGRRPDGRRGDQDTARGPVPGSAAIGWGRWARSAS